jgi:hypothetical protein
MGYFKKESAELPKQCEEAFGPDDDYLANMAIAAREACYCAECGTLHHNEIDAILCFISDAIRQKGDLESNENQTPQFVLLDMHYHLSKAIKGPATDFDNAEFTQQATATALLVELDNLLFHKEQP